MPKHKTPQNRFPMISAWVWYIGTRCVLPGTWYQGTRYPGYQVLGTWYLSSWYQAPGIGNWYLVPLMTDPDMGTRTGLQMAPSDQLLDYRNLRKKNG